eukprot:CAMPEP_0202860118 /NCGR_PEP_ID=MMETSP1391-20130828/1965_1 /ASSEMBLY_ACC=CAM_ASM_000867 /TAXON_ID=1034604 /ORGANISM="Chlamydomonas leiostraca, Strain SAG 11-49" /LENGTH=69 /DNA_ID=CAMNT_0049539253 /DNA_START=461 /DNA_END=670 /DNA_ORIENTATION=-
MVATTLALAGVPRARPTHTGKMQYKSNAPHVHITIIQKPVGWWLIGGQLVAWDGGGARGRIHGSWLQNV